MATRYRCAGDSMKSRRAMVSGAPAIGLAAGPQAIAAAPGGIPLPSGNFSVTAQGSEASCQEGSCVVLSVIEAGAEVRDKAGNVCGTHTAVANTDPPGALPPTVVPVTHVFKVINYDPTTGTGDEALTEYSGGECRGATFDGTRATQVLTGTLHFVISGCGNRIDSVVTALNLSGVGGFSLSFTELQQSPRTSDFCNSR